jgi:Ner family transcriptional regulator
MTATPLAKKASRQDWHPAQVVAELRMKGYSLRQLAILNGYGNPNSLSTVLHRPYPLAEGIVAEALGVKPDAIWPTRYGPDGKPNRGAGGRKVQLPPGAKPSKLRLIRNAQRAGRE